MYLEHSSLWIAGEAAWVSFAVLLCRKIYINLNITLLFSDKKDVLLQWLMVLKIFVNNRIKSWRNGKKSQLIE